MKRALLLVTCVACGASLQGADTRSGGSDALRVTRAVLYQNGVGYFERRGRVEGHVLALRIRPDQIADILKSLTVVDFAKDGRAVSVALPVEKTQSRALADLPPQVRDQGGLLAIVSAFRGARAHVESEDGSADGRILGVEQVEVPTQNGTAPDWRLTILDGSTLRQFDISKISALKILDRTLTVGLEKALDVTLNEGSWKPIELTVDLAGEGPHDVLVSYVVEMPTWRPAYRVVVLPDKQSLLQGWAVVDNVSGEDWRSVQLSLTAGTPLAFAYDLYTPHYVRRPNLTPPQEEQGLAVAPTEDEGGMPMGGDEDGEPTTPAPPPPAAAVAPHRMAGGPGGGGTGNGFGQSKQQQEEPPEPQVSEQDLERNYQALVAGQGVGSLFRYDLQEKVTIPDRNSALVSVVSTKVPGEDVLAFRVGLDSEHPYRAVQLKNETGFVLERGPVAIYRDSTFLGEAITNRLEKGATAFVPYALDTRITVFPEEENHVEGMRLASIENGHIVVESKSVTRFTYDVDNESGEASTLFVERQRRQGWTIRKVGLADDDAGGPPQPGKDGVIEQELTYAVPIKLPEKGHVKIVVEEETPAHREVEIVSSEGRQVIAAYVTSPDADPEVAKQLKAAVDINDKLGQIDRRVAELQSQRVTLTQREDQIRKNMDILRKSAANDDLRKKLETNLADIDTQLDKVSRDLVEQSEARTKLSDDFAAAVKGITLKKK
jgi:hypothetical protein